MMGTADKNKLLAATMLLIGCSPQLLNGYYNPALLQHPLLFWTVDILTLAMMPVGLYLWGLRAKVFTNEELGLNLNFHERGDVIKLVIFSIAMSLAVFYGFRLFMWIGAQLDNVLFKRGFEDVVFDFSMALGGEGPKRIIIIIYFSATAGFAEEFLYRGLCWRLFPPSIPGAVLFIILSALLFGLIHWEGGFIKMFTGFGLGLMLALAYLFIKNLWPLIIGHFIANFFLFYGLSSH